MRSFRRWSAALVAVGMLAAGLVVATAGPALAFGTTTERVSVAGDGTQADSPSRGGDMSADGTVVAFTSSATTLTPDANSQWSVYVHDRTTGATEQVSVASADAATPGEANNQSAGTPSISADGRYVAFRSLANNLVDDDSGFGQDIFVHDRDTGITTMVSRSATTGAPANGRSDDPEISADGRHVVFSSDASDLVAGDDNGVADVFIHHLDTGVTELVSATPGGAQGSSSSHSPAIDADGSVVAFTTTNTFDPADTDGGSRDVYVRDFGAGTTELVSHPTDGLDWNVQRSGLYDDPVISGDGTHVGFMSSFVAWVRLRDESLTVSASDNRGRLAAGRMSDDGRYYLQFEYETNCSTCTWYPWLFDLDSGTRVNVGLTAGGTVSDLGALSATERPGISADGTAVAFHSDGTDLVAGDTNGMTDVFVRAERGDPEPPDSTGPVASAVSAAPTTTAEGTDVTVDAVIDDTDTGGTPILTAEISIDGGTWTTMDAVDGAYDEVTEDVRHVVAAPAVGTHEACVRGTDSESNVGDPTCTSFVVEEAENQPPVIDPIADQEGFTGETISFTVTATDPDGDDSAIVWSLGPNAPVDATLGATDGVFAWTPAAPGQVTFDVIATDADGDASSEPVTITVTDRPDTAPIVFVSDRDGDNDLWSVAPDGGEPIQLADLNGDDNFPRWSPDGSKIAFIKNSNTTSGRLWLIDADGTDATLLTSVQARFAPAWSPDGTEIMFVANSGDGDFDLHGIAPDGTGLRKIADTTANETHVTWVGDRLAVDRGSALVLVDPVTGDDLDSFTVGVASGYDGEPGGDRVALAQSTSTGIRIVLLDTTDGTITPVTDGSLRDTAPAWSPDGTELAFGRRATTSDTYDLYTIGIDGTGLTQLTTDPGRDSAPDWFGTAAPPPPSLDIVITEGIGIADVVIAAPQLNIFITETIGVADHITAPPTISIHINETIGITDEITAAPQLNIFITETIGVADHITAPPTISIHINETIGVTDAVAGAPQVNIFIGEGIGVADHVTAPPTISILINEAIGVTDAVAGAPQVNIFVGEGIGVTDAVSATVSADDDGVELVPGDPIEISGDGFAPDSEIDLGLESEFLLLETITADGSGGFETTIDLPPPDELPPGFAGAHHLVARGLDPDGDLRELRFPVTILAPVDVELDEDNPTSVAVDDKGTLHLGVTLTEAWAQLTDQLPDPGDASMVLRPVAGGGEIQGDCEPRGGPSTDPWSVELTCTVDRSDLGIGTYTVVAAIGDDISLFSGSDVAALGVVQPGPAAVSGSGSFTWPGSQDEASFTFQVRTNRHKTTGSFVLRRDHADGSTTAVRSSDIATLSTSAHTDPATASFSGDATVWTTGAGGPGDGYLLNVYVSDSPTGDRLWVEVLDGRGHVVDLVSLPRPATDETVAVDGDIDLGVRRGRDR